MNVTPDGMLHAQHANIDDFSGSTVGSYTLLERIGSGGFAHVYRAEHAFLKQKVALKVLAGAHWDKKRLMRFYKEARLAAALNHPNISCVRDFGIDSMGRPFLVMDLEEGMTLRTLLAKVGRLHAEDVVVIARQLVSAIAYAHARGILHRDIKPSNIIISRDYAGHQAVRLIVFGAAKVDDEQALTKSGELFGTPEYMSPEQCQGQPADARSDIYALGCVLFEALTGKLPFEGRSDMEVLHRQINEPAPPIEKEIRAPRFLKRAIKKALEKRPDKRFQTADQLAVALGISASAPGFEPRRPALTILTIVAAAATIFGAIIGGNLAGAFADYDSEMQIGQTDLAAGNLDAARAHFESAIIAAMHSDPKIRSYRCASALEALKKCAK
jgi:serine/threonine-protein kinase